MERLRVPSGSPYEPIAGFSRAIRVGNVVKVAGTGPVMPPGEALPPDAYAQARRCLAIIASALEQAGATTADVVRTCMYATHAEDWDAVARAHGEVFGEIRPAATFVVVAALVHPDWRIEIEAEAIVT